MSHNSSRHYFHVYIIMNIVYVMIYSYLMALFTLRRALLSLFVNIFITNTLFACSSDIISYNFNENYDLKYIKQVSSHTNPLIGFWCSCAVLKGCFLKRKKISTHPARATWFCGMTNITILFSSLAFVT